MPVISHQCAETAKYGALYTTVDVATEYPGRAGWSFFTDSTKKLEYADAPYHTSKDNNLKSRKPTNGQQVLESSIEFKPTSNRRVGYDTETSEFVVFDNTERHIYHGHVRSWPELDVRMQNALIEQGIINRRGKIIK